MRCSLSKVRTRVTRRPMSSTTPELSSHSIRSPVRNVGIDEHADDGVLDDVLHREADRQRRGGTDRRQREQDAPVARQRGGQTDRREQQPGPDQQPERLPGVLVEAPPLEQFVHERDDGARADDVAAGDRPAPRAERLAVLCGQQPDVDSSSRYPSTAGPASTVPQSVRTRHSTGTQVSVRVTSTPPSRPGTAQTAETASWSAVVAASAASAPPNHRQRFSETARRNRPTPRSASRRSVPGKRPASGPNDGPSGPTGRASRAYPRVVPGGRIPCGQSSAASRRPT